MKIEDEDAASVYSLCASSLCGSRWVFFLFFFKTNTTENVQKHKTHGCCSCRCFFFSTMFCIIVVLLTSCSVLFDWSQLNLFMVLFLLYWGEQHPLGLEFKIYIASFAADRQTPRLSVPSALTGCCGSTAHTAVCCDWPSPAAWTQAGWAGPSVRSQTSHCWRQRCWQLGSSLLDVGEAWGRKSSKITARSSGRK